MSSAPDLQSALATALTRQWGETVSVTDVRRLSGGASLETWLATVSSPGTTQGRPTPVIVRRDRPGPPTSSRTDEARLLQRVAQAGVPVPKVLALGDGDEVGQAYLVMEFLEGETIPRKLLRDEQFAPARAVLVHEVAAGLARIHTVPARDVPYLAQLQSPAEMVEALASMVKTYEHDSPVLELAVRWLYENLPTAGTPVLVHGDVRNGNLMVTPTGLAAILDWELAHPGWGAEDLGWFCVRAWQFGQDDKPAGGFGTREALLSAYNDAGGEPVTLPELRFWEMFGTFKWGATCLSQVAVHLRGYARSPELAAIGRRLNEVEYDLVRLMQEA